MKKRRWDPCVYHRGKDAELFLKEFFNSSSRRILFIGGAGFDPRSSIICTAATANVDNKSIDAIFIREERPTPNVQLKERAEANAKQLSILIPQSEMFSVDIFDVDQAVIGGSQIARKILELDLSRWTDIILDFSSLSKGISFPATRQILERVTSLQKMINIHIMVTDETDTDVEIQEIGADRAEMIPGFQGIWGLSEVKEEAARLWIPHLIKGQKAILDRIHRYISPDDVCPILPFPSTNPRRCDELIEEYGEELQSVWEVEPRDLLYADERNPLDVYRTILKIDDLRTRVFEGTGGSVIVLSPVGTKLLAIGALLAALERDFPVAYVEAIEYHVDFEKLDNIRTRPGDIVHIWVYGEAYGDQSQINQ